MLPAWVIYIASALNMVGAVSYAWDTFRGHTKPNRVTWTLWTLASFIIFLGQVSEGVGLPALLPLSGAIATSLVLVASFLNKDAYWKVSTLDLICGGISLLALIVWAITREGLYAIFLSILADFMASVPTIVKAYRAPRTESSLAYLMAAISAILTMLTINNWTPKAFAFALYVTLCAGLIYTLIKFPKLRLPGHAPEPTP